MSSGSVLHFVESLGKDGMFRATPPWEAFVCNRICKIYPTLGIDRGLLYGTPTPFAVNPITAQGKVIMDNTFVAKEMKLHSKLGLTIVIGNAKDPEKAEKKKDYFTSIYEFSKGIFVERVDAEGFERWGNNLGRTGDTCCIVLMTSGEWPYKNGKSTDIDLSFEERAVRMVNKYPKLHILAMVRCYHGFKICHLNQQKSVVHISHPEGEKDVVGKAKWIVIPYVPSGGKKMIQIEKEERDLVRSIFVVGLKKGKINELSIAKLSLAEITEVIQQEMNVPVNLELMTQIREELMSKYWEEFTGQPRGMELESKPGFHILNRLMRIGLGTVPFNTKTSSNRRPKRKYLLESGEVKAKIEKLISENKSKKEIRKELVDMYTPKITEKWNLHGEEAIREAKNASSRALSNYHNRYCKSKVEEENDESMNRKEVIND